MRCILPTAFAALSLLIGSAALQSANATVNAHQERTAEALCQVDPSLCGAARR